MLKRLETSTVAKTAMAILIFSLVVGGWMIFTRHRDATAMLPDDRSAQGACSLWFIGSSSIHRWTTLGRDMAPWTAHNRGINDATLSDILPRFANARETPPRAIILYAGENDLAFGVPLRTIARQVAAFLDVRTRKMGDVPVLVLSAKPSPGRWSLLGEQRLLNATAQRLIPRFPDTYYVDITTPLLKDGRLGDNYQADGVHMNAAGYRIWADAVHQRLNEILPASTIRECVSA